MKKNPDDIYEVEYVYLGETVDFMDRIFETFRNAKNEIAKFNKIKNVFFGESYLISKEGSIKRRSPPQPEKQTVFPTEKEKLAYYSNLEIVKHQRNLRKKAMDLKRPHPDLARAINLLKPFARSMDYITLDRFMKGIKNELTKKVKK